MATATAGIPHASAAPAGDRHDRPIEQRARFDRVRYANCWEDADVVARALAPLEGARCLSIASGGDNSFSLLARGAAHVLAVDLSPAQIALVALKRAAFTALDHPALVAFLGARPSAHRLADYATLRPHLDAAARAHWDAHPDAVAGGIVHAGRLEAYFRLFRRFVLPLVHDRTVVEAMLAPRTRGERERFHRNTWDSWRWRAACRAFFCRPAMGRL
ncbi:MAG TPA: DUF3419 family protein, partial [Vicinamibacteria bacterium]|nr:DUF3419 family protein [Vicinamibacteria bacterium]